MGEDFEVLAARTLDEEVAKGAVLATQEEGHVSVDQPMGERIAVRVLVLPPRHAR